MSWKDGRGRQLLAHCCRALMWGSTMIDHIACRCRRRSEDYDTQKGYVDLEGSCSIGSGVKWMIVAGYLRGTISLLRPSSETSCAFGDIGW